MARDQTEGPTLSVVVPVRDGAEFLPRSLAALRASDLPVESWELIVVDDGSLDSSAEIAAQYADRVVRVPPPAAGPPAARNRGIELARAPLVVFVDADVSVHPDALRRIRDLLAEKPELSAVFGAYDRSPSAPGLVSQYRNLLHSYVHRRDQGEAVTFWTGLGAIRRQVLEQCGGFDPGERLDDVELGYRMSSQGHQILLNPDIQGTHLKRWTLNGMVATDIVGRGVPWVRLLLQGRRPPGRPTLNLRVGEQVMTALTAVAVVTLMMGIAWGEGASLLGAGMAVGTVIAADREFLSWLAAQRGWRFAISAIPLRLLYFTLNGVAVALALLPLSWRRRNLRQGSALTGKWIARPAPRAPEAP